jgi:hypothetical protein
MKGDSLIKIIFDIIVLIVLVFFIFYIIIALIGLAMGEDFKYIGYLNSIADAINNANGQIFIDNYDYNYVFVLTYNNGWYLQLYHCFPPNFVVGLLSVKLVYWNVSTTNNKDIVFAPALAFCKLIKQRSLNNINQINITIQGLNDNAGLLVLDSNDKYLNNLIINMPLTDNFFSYTSLAILNDTNITCNSNGCTFMSKIKENGNTYKESGSIYCSPNQNINTNNNNLPYNPSVCVELSGFPQNRQVQLSNFEGEIIHAITLGTLFQEDFPLLYFAGSLPPTVMYIDVNSNDGTADINIYIGETVS